VRRLTPVGLGLVLALLLALLATARGMQTALAQPAATEAQVKAIAGDLMCECGGAVTVADCGNSAVANGMRAIIQQQVELGKSRGEVLDHFVTLYGECILAVPRKSGIGLAAWLAPLVAIVAGGAVLGGSVWVWSQRTSGRQRQPASGPDPSRPAAGGELDDYERRVEEELEKFE
jgi:cytochrome c-type biogenesis protein CcmH